MKRKKLISSYTRKGLYEGLYNSITNDFGRITEAHTQMRSLNRKEIEQKRRKISHRKADTEMGK